MKKHRKLQLKLVDVIRIVSQYARNDSELQLAVADLINRGLVKIEGRFHNRRVVVA
jgi:hypothetical protein